MKYISILLLSTCSILAGPPEPPLPSSAETKPKVTNSGVYRTTCLDCQTVQTNKPMRVCTTGSHTKPDGTVIEERSAFFKCKHCNQQFSVRMPDRKAVVASAVELPPEAAPKKKHLLPKLQWHY